jgi:hypothetical protein
MNAAADSQPHRPRARRPASSLRLLVMISGPSDDPPWTGACSTSQQAHQHPPSSSRPAPSRLSEQGQQSKREPTGQRDAKLLATAAIHGQERAAKRDVARRRHNLSGQRAVTEGALLVHSL